MVNDLDYEGIKFPVSKKDYSKIEQKIIFPLMYFVMKIIYQMKNLKTVWTYCWLQMNINHIMSISKILIDLCAIRQKIKIKNIFRNIVYNFLLVKEF